MATTVTDKKIIIDLSINSADATKAIVNAKNDIDKLKESLKQWDQAEKDHTVSHNEWVAATSQIKANIKDLNNTVKANEKILVDNIKVAKTQGESLNAMRASLKNLTKQYDEMNEAERNSAKGKDMLKHISDLTTEIKTLEYEQQIFKRNVGNYMDSLGGGKINVVIQQFKQLSVGTMNLGVAFKNATTMAKQFGAQMLKMLSNPWVLAIAAIVGVVAKLVKEFKKNDDAMTALHTAFAAFQPILDLINKGFNVLVGAVTKVINGFTALVTKIASISPAFRQATEAAQQYVKDLDALQETERQYMVESAKNEAQIAELRDKAADKEKYSAEERIKFNKQAQALEEKNYKTQKEIAKERLRLAKEEQKRENDYSDERKDKIAELEAAYIKADTDYYNAHRSLTREQQRFEKEVDAEEREKEKERKQKAKEWEQQRKEMRENELKAVREYQDAVIAAMDEGFEKHIKEIQVQGEREIEDLKKRLKEEKNLTAKARESINSLITLKQRELNKKLVLEEANYWSIVRDTITKALNSSEGFINTGKVSTDLYKMAADFKKKIAEIDAAGKEATDNLASAFRAAFKAGIKESDSVIKSLARIQPDLDFSNFMESLKKMREYYVANVGGTVEEFNEKLNSSKWYTQLLALYKQYINAVGEQSRQVNQMIIDLTENSAKIIQKSMFNAITNGTVQAYENMLSKNAGFARAMADKFGENYLDQMRGIMMNVDSMIADAYSQISLTDNVALIERLRSYIKDLEEVRNILFSTNELEKQALINRQKRAQLVSEGKSNEIELTKLSLEESKAENERLKAQQAYLNSIKDTVKARAEAYEQSRKDTANQWEALEKERKERQHQIDAMKQQSIDLGIELDQNKVNELEQQIRDIIAKENELTKEVSEKSNELAATGFTSIEEFNLAQDELVTKVMESNAKIAEETKKLSDAQIDSWVTTFNTIADAAGQLANAFGNLFTVLAEDNEQMQKYANAMAYVDIMMSMATGIASAVAEGMKMGWPAAAVMIPVGIATVVSGIAEAISVYKQNNKVKSSPKFSKGGLVGDKTTTRTDDSVDAKLSVGEYVVKSAVVKALGVDFFDRLNGTKKKKSQFDTHFASGGVVSSPNTQTYIQTQQMDFNYAQIGEIFKEAVSEVQPVVSVREINDMQTRVSVKENTASYK